MVGRNAELEQQITNLESQTSCLHRAVGMFHEEKYGLSSTGENLQGTICDHDSQEKRGDEMICRVKNVIDKLVGIESAIAASRYVTD